MESSNPSTAPGSPALPPAQAQTTCGLATASLITGIAVILFGPLSGIPAIIMGHIARRKIKDSDGQLKGGGMALTGLIIGYFSLLPILLIPLLLPALSSAKEAARKASAKNDMTQIVIAVKSFYTDYGIYPVAQISQSTGDITFGDGTSDNKVLINVLRAVEQDHSINTRQMTYIDLPQVRNLTEPRSGIDADGNFYDPWGHQYIIRIDSGYSGKIKTPDDQQLDTGVIVWSLGRDGKDIICSWK